MGRVSIALSTSALHHIFSTEHIESGYHGYRRAKRKRQAKTRSLRPQDGQ